MFSKIKGQCSTSHYTKSNGDCACGLIIEKDLSWTEAVQHCLEAGARLPEIYNEEDNTDIFNLKVFVAVRKNT